MTNEQQFRAAAKTINQWQRDAFLGTLENEDGQTYCHVYDAEKLNDVQKCIIIRGVDGTLERDVWSQVLIISEAEYLKLKS